MERGIVLIVIVVLFSVLAAFLSGAIIQNGIASRDGYIACLLDIQNNRLMRYVLKKQTDGETRWVKNTEVDK